MPWQDVCLLFEELDTPAPQTWTMQDENAAQLVDVMTYWLNAEYAKWTTDPDEARDAARNRERFTAPPFPIIEPVAHRPPAVHAAAVARYEALLEQYGAATTPDVDDDATPIQRFAGLDLSAVRVFPQGGEQQ